MPRVLRIGLLILALALLWACGDTRTAAPGDHGRTAEPGTAVPVLSTAPPAPTGLGTLAYIHQGDLWVRGLPAGAPLRLTTHGRASRPRWSPSGEWISFCGDSTLYIARADGTDTHIVGPCVEAAWSPAEDRLLHHDNYGMRITDPDSWQSLSVGGDSAVWSGDGSALALSSVRMLPDQTDSGMPLRSAELRRVPSDGGAARLLSSGAAADEDILPAGWAGSTILFWANPLFSASLLADGAPLRAAPTDRGAPLELLPAMLAYPDFLDIAPDGARVAATSGGGRASWSDKQIVAIDLASGAQVALSDPHLAAVSPVWAPDGQRVAYAAAPDAPADSSDTQAQRALAQRHIWSAHADGTERRRLTDDPAYRDERPRWSDDGESILFARLDQKGQASVWLMQANGSGLTLVANSLTIDQDNPGQPGYFGYIPWDNAFAWHQVK
ncbi:MAG TPA: hypothetical protein VFS21_09040 [Roseiflexaceae bacterium]|nr:hypothetical protein [Roseiflexaceae bacterium]